MTDLFGQKKIYAANNAGNLPQLSITGNTVYFGWLEFPEVWNENQLIEFVSHCYDDDKTHAWMNEVVLGGKDG